MSEHTTGTNPKDVIGRSKIDLSAWPSAATIHGSHALMDGRSKGYPAWNWRDAPVNASVYAAACERHLADWFNGQDNAEDSGVHHLGHALASLAIMVDAMEHGTLVDDRPAWRNPGVIPGLLERLAADRRKRGTLGLDPALTTHAT